MDFDRILDNVFVGSHPESTGDIDALSEMGVTAALNLQTNDDYAYLNVDWPGQRAHYFAQKIEVTRVPIPDFDERALRDKLPAAVHYLARLLDEGHIVYVHCSAGVNRSPSVVIAYLHWVRQWPLEQAEHFVRSRHECMPITAAIRSARWA